ncbi:MAG: hypothetical protein ACI4KA_11225 [Oscillospiraceae bacterium]
MKKRIFALLVGCMLLSGCGSDDGTTVSRTEEAAPPVSSEIESSIPAYSEEQTEAAPPVSEEVQEKTEEIVPETKEETAEALPESDVYVEYLAGCDNTFLGLPQKDKVYIFRSTGETAEIDGEECYGVSCYDEHESVLYYMCDFYVNGDGTKVYRYYQAEEKYSLLPESAGGFVRMDPTTQTAEEIFKEANALYGYFDLEALAGINSITLEKEVNGSTWKYYLVADERLDTKAELLNALSCYFSDEIINSLMDTQQYIEGDDGKLYTACGARGANIAYRSTVYDLSILTADTAEFTACSTYEWEGEVTEDTITYSAVKRDGRWYFTSFELPY